MLTDLGIPETKLQNALLEVWNKTDLIQSETPPQPASQLQIPTDIACSSSAEAGSAVPSASAEDMLHDITEPASIHSHQHHMKTHVQYAGQSHVTDEEFADNQEAAVPLNPAPESQSNAVAARQLEASADTSQPHTHSGQGQHLGSGHASLEQLHISSSDSHVADADVASRSATSQPEDMHKAQQANRASGSNQTAAGSGRSVPSNGSIQRSDGSIQHSDGSIQRTNDVSQLSSIGPQCHEGQQGSLEVATQGVDVMSDGAVQGSGKPLTLFTSTVTGEGLSQLLVEVERKVYPALRLISAVLNCSCS